jgi:hypothetical protein
MGCVLDSATIRLEITEETAPHETVPPYSASPNADNADPMAGEAEKKKEERFQIEIDEKKVDVTAANERRESELRAAAGARGVPGKRGSETTTGEPEKVEEPSIPSVHALDKTNPLLDYYDDDLEKAVQRLSFFNRCYDCCGKAEFSARLIVSCI